MRAALLVLCAASAVSANLHENRGAHHWGRRASVPASSSASAVSSTAGTEPTTSASSTASTAPESSTATTATSAPAATPTGVFETITARRIAFAIRDTNKADVGELLGTLGADGTWPDVDYTAGCDAQRANWPAQKHWDRIDLFAAAWHGGLEGSLEWEGNDTLRDAMLGAMDWWFANDFTNPDCLDSGSKAKCPCGTPGLWNGNWYPNAIGVPADVGQACVLARAALGADRLQRCTDILARGYTEFHEVGNPPHASGANVLLLAAIGVDLAILAQDAAQLADAYKQTETQLVLVPGAKQDGIRADGSFGQHAGLLYNGNYGKDFVNNVMELEIEAAGTEYAAGPTAVAAFEALWDANRWMVVFNAATGVLHWDLSVLSRFVSFPVSDKQATSGLKVNLTDVKTLGDQWGSDVLQTVYREFKKKTPNANAGPVVGNRVFQSNDYIVQRGDNYVTTLKMYSTRTLNTECSNAQNPLGFHLADFMTLTYVQGDEYEDVAGAWDWELLPGITVDYGNTPLSCDRAKNTGLEAMVGGVSSGAVGAGAMKYTNPLTGDLSWQKAVFFLPDDTQLVMVSNITSLSNASVFSVLDQRKHSGDVYVDGALLEDGSQNVSAPASLWHGDVGYLFEEDMPATLTVSVEEREADWSKIGISTVKNTTDMFTAYLDHTNLNASLQYILFPGVSRKAFEQKSAERRITIVANDAEVAAVYDEDNEVFAAVFWGAEGGEVERDGHKVSVDGNVALIVDECAWTLTVSDPTWSLSSVEIVLDGRTYNVTLPTDPLTVGTSVTHAL